MSNQFTSRFLMNLIESAEKQKKKKCKPKGKIAMEDMRFRGPPEMKDKIYEHVRKDSYDSLSDFVRKSIVNQLEREEK